MLKKFILPATLLIVGSQLVSRILGVFRDHLFANTFGATSGVGIFDLDTYFAAFRLPDLVYSLLVFGTLSAAFVPLLAEKKNGDELNKFTSNVFNVLFVGILILTGFIFIFAEPLTKMITPGFSSEKIVITAQLLRIQLLAPIFFTFSAIFGGLAQHFHKFVWYSLAPIFYNLGIIFGTIFWGQEFGVFGASWGVALGAFAHAAIQLPGIWRSGFRWKPVFHLRQLKPFLRLAGPRVVAVSASQLQFVTITIFASFVGGGTLTIFNFAWNLASLPLGVVGIAFATTSFAGLARLVKSRDEFRIKLHANLLGVFFWTLPLAVGLFLLREEITRLILSGGLFSETDVMLVSQSVALFACAVPAMSIYPLLSNAFFAQKNTRVPLIISVFSLSITGLGCYFLIGKYLSSGLTVAYASAAILGTTLLFLNLPRDFQKIPFIKFSKILLSSILLGVLIFIVGKVWIAKDFFELAVKISALSILGGSFYLGATRISGINFRQL